LVGDGSNDILVSAASAYEIAAKANAGRLTLPAPADVYLPDRLAANGMGILPIELAHALRAGSLPPVHRDPWDRLLVAQAQIEGMPIITADDAIGRYEVETAW
jgi:PIN domain nuclease of toxin-antitoxin system